MRCNLCGAICVVQPYAVQAMWCYLCCAIYVRHITAHQSSHRERRAFHQQSRCRPEERTHFRPYVRSTFSVYVMSQCRPCKQPHEDDIAAPMEGHIFTRMRGHIFTRA